MTKDELQLRREYLKEDYPKNLLLIANVTGSHFKPDFPVENIPQETLEGLNYVLSTFKDRDRAIIQLRYQERNTYKQIGDIIGVSIERVRSLDAKLVWSFCKPPFRGYIKYGKEAYEAMIAERKEAELKAYNENILQRRLEDLDLSVRSFNCIKKGGVDVVKDFAFYTEEQILNIRNLGKKSIIEIATKLVALGIHETAWENFLPTERK